jgi:hypothetical protein
VAASQAMKTLLNGTFGSGAKNEELTYGDNEELRIGLERKNNRFYIDVCLQKEFKLCRNP